MIHTVSHDDKHFLPFDRVDEYGLNETEPMVLYVVPRREERSARAGGDLLRRAHHQYEAAESLRQRRQAVGVEHRKLVPLRGQEVAVERQCG